MLSYPIWYLISPAFPKEKRKKEINFKNQKQKLTLKKEIHDKLMMTMTIRDKFKFEKMSKPNNLIQK